MSGAITVLIFVLYMGVIVVGHGYGVEFSKIIMFNEAQKSRNLPSNHRVTWNANSSLRDGLDNGVDLVGWDTTTLVTMLNFTSQSH